MTLSQTFLRPTARLYTIPNPSLFICSSATPPGPGVKRDLFKELGVRTFINAAGTYTFMTGSLMREEVVDGDREIVIGRQQPRAPRDDPMPIVIGIAREGDVEAVSQTDQPLHRIGR